MRFRKQPVEIDAFRVDDALHCAERDWYALPQWLIDAYEGRNEAGVRSVVFTSEGVHITTLEGTMIGARGDWIIRGVKGELYPCKNEIFLATYEPAKDEGVQGLRQEEAP